MIKSQHFFVNYFGFVCGVVLYIVDILRLMVLQFQTESGHTYNMEIKKFGEKCENNSVKNGKKNSVKNGKRTQRKMVKRILSETTFALFVPLT